jgi:hypothetical protein
MRTVFPRGKGTRSTHLVCEHKMTFGQALGEDENPYLTLAADLDVERTGNERSSGGRTVRSAVEGGDRFRPAATVPDVIAAERGGGRSRSPSLVARNDTFTSHPSRGWNPATVR